MILVYSVRYNGFRFGAMRYTCYGQSFTTSYPACQRRFASSTSHSGKLIGSTRITTPNLDTWSSAPLQVFFCFWLVAADAIPRKPQKLIILHQHMSTLVICTHHRF